MLRAITFDCWGTLLDAHGTFAVQRVARLAAHLPGYTPEQLAQAYEAGQEEFRRIEAMGLSLSTASVLSVTLSTLGATLSPDAFSDTSAYWEEALLEHPPHLLDGVLQVLQALRERGLALALISDTGLTPGRVMRRVLAGHGLLDFFQHCTFSNEIGVTKRRPLAYLSTLAALGVPAAQAMHVGDSPDTDIRGAKAAGLRAALLLQNTGRREGIPLADVVLERIAELPGRIRDDRP